MFKKEGDQFLIRIVGNNEAFDVHCTVISHIVKPYIFIYILRTESFFKKLPAKWKNIILSLETHTILCSMHTHIAWKIVKPYKWKYNHIDKVKPVIIILLFWTKYENSDYRDVMGIICRLVYDTRFDDCWENLKIK